MPSRDYLWVLGLIFATVVLADDRPRKADDCPGWTSAYARASTPTLLTADAIPEEAIATITARLKRDGHEAKPGEIPFLMMLQSPWRDSYPIETTYRVLYRPIEGNTKDAGQLRQVRQQYERLVEELKEGKVSPAAFMERSNALVAELYRGTNFRWSAGSERSSDETFDFMKMGNLGEAAQARALEFAKRGTAVKGPTGDILGHERTIPLDVDGQPGFEYRISSRVDTTTGRLTTLKLYFPPYDLAQIRRIEAAIEKKLEAAMKATGEAEFLSNLTDACFLNMTTLPYGRGSSLAAHFRLNALLQAKGYAPINFKPGEGIDLALFFSERADAAAALRGSANQTGEDWRGWARSLSSP